MAATQHLCLTLLLSLRLHRSLCKWTVSEGSPMAGAATYTAQGQTPSQRTAGWCWGTGAGLRATPTADQRQAQDSSGHHAS